MKKDGVVVYGIYYLNDSNNIAEVEAVFDDKNIVKVLLYSKNEDSIEKMVSIDVLSPVRLSDNILRVLGFKETEGRLFGLVNENYFYQKANDVRIIKDQGVFKFVQPSVDPNDFYGCKFITMPYLHQLQGLIGKVKVDNLFFAL
jgi:hypothetical protein